jgi:tetratricopeptide (TPR) repeat protein
VRVNAQLISAETGAQIWTDKFDTGRGNLLTMEDEIVTRLARSLEIETAAIEAARVARMPPGNIDAQDLAMRCQAGFESSTDGSPEQAAAFGLCERALQIDGRNALALSITASHHAGRVINGLSADPNADIQRAGDLVARALALEPDSYWAHLAKGALLLAQKRDEEALVEAERSRALNPSFIPAYSVACFAHWALAQPKKTIECADTAIRLSPRDPALDRFYFAKGLAYSMLSESTEAIDMYRRVIAMAPQYSAALRSLVAELALNGQLPEARDALQRYLSLKDVRIRTIAQHEAFGENWSDNPAFRAWLQRFNGGLREAGMPEK